MPLSLRMLLRAPLRCACLPATCCQMLRPIEYSPSLRCLITTRARPTIALAGVRSVAARGGGAAYYARRCRDVKGDGGKRLARVWVDTCCMRYDAYTAENSAVTPRFIHGSAEAAATAVTPLIRKEEGRRQRRVGGAVMLRVVW